MNRKEIGALLTLAMANFPNMQQKDLKPTAILWEELLSDLDYEITKKALIKVLATSKFFPSIAEIREAAMQIMNPRILDAMEAWGLIVEAIRKYGFYNEAKAMEFLPEDVRILAKQFTWRELCLNEEPDILRAQFRMAWDSFSKRQNQLNVLPTDIRFLLVNDKKKLN